MNICMQKFNDPKMMIQYGIFVSSTIYVKVIKFHLFDNFVLMSQYVWD